MYDAVMDISIPIDERSENLSRIHRRRVSAGVVFGDALYGPGGVCGPRIQGDYQLVSILRGSAKVHVDSDVVEIPVNHVALFVPNRREQFLFSTSGPTRHTWCSISVTLVDEGLRERLLGLHRVIPMSERLHRLMEMGLGVPLNANERSNSLIEALGRAVFEAFLLDSATVEEPYPKSLRLALQRIESGLGFPLDAAALADSAGISQAHLIRLFRLYLQSTPARYLWDARTRRGIELLKETGLPISEIAQRVGFQSAFHFSRRVKETLGVSPRTFRAKEWQVDE